jgi:hypothetical protein
VNADLLNLGIRHLRRRAERGELASHAVLRELARLYAALVEPPPEALAEMTRMDDHALDTESSIYAIRLRNETLRDGQPETEADDGQAN